MRNSMERGVRCRAAVLQSGDKVLFKQLALTGKHKLADKWESLVML